jgi:hypothetical protein
MRVVMIFIVDLRCDLNGFKEVVGCLFCGEMMNSLCWWSGFANCELCGRWLAQGKR